MSNVYSIDFKIKAVKETLVRPRGVTLNDKAKELGICRTTLSKWITTYQPKILKEAQDADENSGSNTDNNEHNSRTRKGRRRRGRCHHQPEPVENGENPSTVDKSCQSNLKQYQAEIKQLKNELLVKNRVISGMAELIAIQQSQAISHIY